MPQSYTEGGDTLQNLARQWYAAQSFTPETNFVLRHIDINLRNYHTTRTPTIWLYLADANHKPTGSILSQSIRHYSENWNIYNVFRMRADMEPVQLIADTEYVIVIHSFALDRAWHQQWQYDKTDATYTRGIRLFSANGGVDWTTRPNDDHIFAVFGTPPVPEPPPPPPVYHWAIIDIEQIPTATGYKIIATTNVPCHLYFYWTTHEPNKHPRTIIQRGLTVPTASQYCFVDWHENEQAEPGDTIYHTFVKEPWAVCETRWFTFRGKIDGTWSPSVGPIFKKHRSYVPPPPVTITFYPEPGVAVDGYAYRHQADNTYTILRDSPGTIAFDAIDTIAIELWTGWGRNKWRRMYRGHLLYDTSSIPNTATILEAKIRYLIFYISRRASWPDLDLCVVASSSLLNTALVAADYQNIGADLLSDTLLNIQDIVALPVWWEFPLNAAGLAAINKTGISKFAIRLNTYDRLATAPPWIQWKGYGLDFWATEKGAGFQPELIVKYQE